MTQNRTPNTATYQIINHMSLGPQVHAEGCRDISRQVKSNWGDAGWTFTAEVGSDLAYEAASDMYNDHAYEQDPAEYPTPESYWQECKSEFKVHGCAAKANKATKATKAPKAPKAPKATKAPEAPAEVTPEVTEVEVPAPGTPMAAMVEMARRTANKTSGTRTEAASEWAFSQSGPALLELATQV